MTESSLSISNISSDIGVRAALWRPLYLPQSAWLEHIPFAFWLIAQHKPRLVVELGSHYGASYFAFCQAVDSLSLDTRCYAVDTWKGDDHAGFYGEDVYAMVSARNKALYSNFSFLIRSTFADTAQYFSDSSIDLLHIDGLHTEDAVRSDVETWLPKLSDRALLLLHDTNVRERNFGVTAVFDELRRKHKCFEFAHGHGLGVVAVGESLNPEVKDLLDVNMDDRFRHDIRNFFAKLGVACADAHIVHETEKRRYNYLSGGEKH